ncbi:Rieske 2Fe-2S domain-containing protein [Amycolatopsis taiwanensis]|uniref:Rieske-type oxygenase n=1 Tax=Amycolatopsis taiwanensis TaxID=342230 RepID=A0A9W6VLC4_9PSEU|nr:Rieske 2Fe-2S domain-containing protein [Amycolatopsis taiwanensis]GLY71302.1 3-ketosteroid-9-alpha-hydroxylase oxygenase subunit [Amycolatopsis taiwanensis]
MTKAIDNDVRTIEAAPAPTRFARGWHCLGLAREFSDGKPHTVTAFGDKLVVFQGSDGNLNVLDAYCRHMGGDLSQGTVKGNEVACPFHDWRWGGDGKCKQIPYARRVPLRARTRAWQTLVQDGMLFVWNDPEGNPPIEAQKPPRIEGALDEGWTDWVWYQTFVHTNCREIIDNVVDMAHFFYVHYSFPTYFKNIFEGHVAAQHMNGKSREDVRAGDGSGPQLLGNSSVAAYYGPSFMIDDLTYHYEDRDIKTTLINCHYPVTANSFVLQYGIIVQKQADLGEEAALQVANTQGEYVRRGFEQDVEIWKNKARIDNPLLCEEDGPVYQLRRWYQQFYVDVADIQPEMVERFEFELDTTKPVQMWQKQVEENIAARAARSRKEPAAR